jgi:hypothetical protein
VQKPEKLTVVPLSNAAAASTKVALGPGKSALKTLTNIIGSKKKCFMPPRRCRSIQAKDKIAEGQGGQAIAGRFLRVQASCSGRTPTSNSAADARGLGLSQLHLSGVRPGPNIDRSLASRYVCGAEKYFSL